jgi:hypothetical protein
MVILLVGAAVLPAFAELLVILAIVAGAFGAFLAMCSS